MFIWHHLRVPFDWRSDFFLGCFLCLPSSCPVLYAQGTVNFEALVIWNSELFPTFPSSSWLVLHHHLQRLESIFHFDTLVGSVLIP
jgi:hypothetical protein